MARWHSAFLGLMIVLVAFSASADPYDFFFRPRHAPRQRAPRPHAAPVVPDTLPVPIPRPHPEPAAPLASQPPAVAPPVASPGAAKPTAPAEGPPLPVAPDAPAKPPEPASKPAASEPTLPVPPQAPARSPSILAPVPAPAPPPSVLPSVAAPGPARQPNEDTGCLARLKASAVTAAPISIGTQPDARCTVVDAVKLSSLRLPDGADITFPDGPTLACVTADTFAAYVRELLSPLAKGSYGAPVAKVWTGPGLECRSRDHIAGAKLSAHGQGLAVDIAQMALTDGHIVAVGVPNSDTDRAFETAARAGGCGYFHTTLGPGSDAYHKTHWHFDLEPRGSKGDGKFCQ